MFRRLPAKILSFLVGAASALAALAPAPVLARGVVFDMERVAPAPDGSQLHSLAGGDSLRIQATPDAMGRFMKLKGLTRQENDLSLYYPGLVTLGAGLEGTVAVGDAYDAMMCSQQWTITLNRGARFTVKSLAVQDAMDAPQQLTLQWMLGGQTLSGGGTYNLGPKTATVLESPAGSPWPEVDKMVITGGENQMGVCQWGDFWVGLDNLELQSIKNTQHYLSLMSYQQGTPQNVAWMMDLPNGNITLPTTLPAPVAGYVFDHWNTAQDGSGSRHAPGSVFVLTQDHPLYLDLHARWRRTQTLAVPSFSAASLVPGGMARASAAASSGLPVVFGSATPAVCDVNGDQVRGLAVGSCVVTADQAGDSEWEAASRQSAVIEVGLAPQSIGAITVLPLPLAIGAQATASATASSGLPVAFGTTTPGVCEVLGDQVRGLAAGACVVTADQAGGGGYAAAPQRSESLAVSKLAQSITLAHPGDQDRGALVGMAASASSGLPVVLTATPPAVCVVATAAQVRLVGVGACTVQADQVGDATYAAAPAQSVTFQARALLPGAPVAGVPMPGDRQVQLGFAPPADTGGAAIDRYRITVQPTGATLEGSASPITVTGLTNGQAYRFTVSAHNSAGWGPESAATAAVTPKAAQTISFATPGPQAFGSPPVPLSASASSGLAVAFSTQTPGICAVIAPAQVQLLAVGLCTLRAEQVGDATYAAAPMQTTSFLITAVVPGAPTLGLITPGSGQVDVPFSAPSDTGGAGIDHYRVTVQPGGRTLTGTASPITVTGLANGTAYRFTVSAHNSAGYGAESAMSAPATPKAGQTLVFNGPGPQAFGSPPVPLSASASSGLVVVFSTQTPGICAVIAPAQVQLLAVGSCTLRAEQAGDATYAAAAAQTASFAITAVVPGAPVGVDASGGKGQASIRFAAPAFGGGAAIDHYRVTVQPGGRTLTGTVSPITVTGLANGTAYRFTVSAHNSAGYGAESALSASVTPAVVKSFAGHTPSGLLVTARMVGGGNDCAFNAPRFVPASSVGAPPPGMSLPHGLFAYSLVDCDASPVTMTLDYSSTPGVAYWKYGPTREQPQAHWYAMPGAVVDGNQVTFTLQDGGVGDDDLARNGTIVDPGGPVLRTATVGVPTLGELGRALLAALLGLGAAVHLRHRARAAGQGV